MPADAAPMSESTAIPAGVTTLMLDMDGTILDLAFDNYLWLEQVPAAYAKEHGLEPGEARDRLHRLFHELRGTLDWYCLDHWSERLSLDIGALHRRHRDRIGYLPGARQFLEDLSDSGLRVLLVTNSHRYTLDLKHDVTGIANYFDAIYSSHELRHPKEDRGFWDAMQSKEAFDPATTLFVDDNLAVLARADDYGIANLRQVLKPDTRRPAAARSRFSGIEALSDLGG